MKPQTPLNRLGVAIGKLFAFTPQQPAPATKAIGKLTSEAALDDILDQINRLPDPDDIMRRLGMNRADLRRLEFDDEIGGAMDTRRDAAVSSAWRLDEGVDGGKTAKRESVEVAFVKSQLAKVFDQAMSGAWDARAYGFSVCEAVYQPTNTDGDADPGSRLLGFARVSVKPMQWFDVTREGVLMLTKPNSANRVAVDQKLKFMLTRVRPTYANPYGEALLSRLYWPWYFRHEGWRGWVQFMDRFGDPFVVGKANDPTKLVESLLGMGIKNVIGVGKEDELNVLMQSGGGEFDRMDTRLTERIQKMILGQTLTSGVGDKGSYALGKVHEQVRQDKRMADLRMLKASGQWMVDALWSVNGFQGRPPRFMFVDQVGIETERATRDAALVNANILRLSKDYLLRAYDYEEGDIEIPDEAEPTDPAAKPVPPVPPAKPKPKDKLELAEPGTFTPEQTKVEELIASAMLGAPAQPIAAEDLKRAILAAKDADDLAERLAMLLDRSSPAFEQVLSHAMFAGEVLGFIHADEQ